MADLFSVPCGFSPPGSLPEPVDGIDGGEIIPGGPGPGPGPDIVCREVSKEVDIYIYDEEGNLVAVIPTIVTTIVCTLPIWSPNPRPPGPGTGSGGVPGPGTSTIGGGGPPGPPTELLKIINLFVSDPQETEVTITWDTVIGTPGLPEQSTTLVEYGTQVGVYTDSLAGAFGSSHIVTLTGLDDGVTYFFRASSDDQITNASETGTFTTLQAPNITLTILSKLENVTTGQMVLSWIFTDILTGTPVLEDLSPLVNFGVIAVAENTVTTTFSPIFGRYTAILAPLVNDTTYKYNITVLTPPNGFNGFQSSEFTFDSQDTASNISNIVLGDFVPYTKVGFPPGLRMTDSTWDTGSNSHSHIGWRRITSNGIPSFFPSEEFASLQNTQASHSLSLPLGAGGQNPPGGDPDLIPFVIGETYRITIWFSPLFPNNTKVDSVVFEILATETQPLTLDPGTDPPYRENFFNFKFDPYKKQATSFVPTYIKDNTIFADTRHRSVDSVIRNERFSFEQTNLIANDLEDRHIVASVDPSIKDIIFNLKKPGHTSVPKGRMESGLRNHLLNGSVAEIDGGYLQSLEPYTKKSEKRTITMPYTEKTQFGSPRQTISTERSKTVEAKFTPIEPRNKTVGANLAITKKKAMCPNKYSDLNSELLKLWHIVPSDLFYRIDVATNASGLVTPEHESDDEHITVYDSTGMGHEVLVNVDFTIPGEDYLGNPLNIPLASDRNRGYTLNNRDIEDVMYHMGVENETVLKVVSNSAIDYEVDSTLLDVALSSHYVLELNVSSYTDVDSPDSFIRKTQTQYSLVTNESQINSGLEFKAYPWKILAINHNDPIWNHVQSDSDYQITYTDFSLINQGTSNGEELFIRRIPRYIVLLPVNVTKYNVYNGNSTLEDWNIRSMSFINSPDPNLNKTTLRHHWTRSEDVYNSTDISGRKYSQGVRFTYSASDVPITNTAYREETEPIPRRESGFSMAVRVASSIGENFILDEGATWFDILSRLSDSHFRTYKQGVSSNMIKKFERGEKTNIKILRTSGRDQGKAAISSRLVRLRSGGVDAFPSLLNGGLTQSQVTGRG